jgi:Fur family ferric uptake transcriptional regulator
MGKSFKDTEVNDLRLTKQRRLILEMLRTSEGHMTAPEIHRRAKALLPRLNKSTVYRTLEALKERGLVTETDLGEGRLGYHPAEKGHHHHLICEKCGRVQEMGEHTLTRLKEALLQRYKFQADLKHLAIFGRCENCR